MLNREFEMIHGETFERKVAALIRVSHSLVVEKCGQSPTKKTWMAFTNGLHGLASEVWNALYHDVPGDFNAWIGLSHLLIRFSAVMGAHGYAFVRTVTPMPEASTDAAFVHFLHEAISVAANGSPGRPTEAYKVTHAYAGIVQESFAFADRHSFDLWKFIGDVIRQASEPRFEIWRPLL